MSGPSELAVRQAANRAFTRNNGDCVALALKAEGWNGKGAIQIDDGRNVPVIQSNSALAIREAMISASPDAPVVVLTALQESELGADLLARFSRQRITAINVWDSALEAFGARSASPQLLKLSGLPPVIENLQPSGGYRKAPNGLLTESHCWDEIWSSILGTAPQTSGELAAMLSTANENDLKQRLVGLPAAVLNAAARRLDQLVGPAASSMLYCAQSRGPSLLLASGLVARVVTAAEDQELLVARGQIKDWFGRTLDKESGAGVAQATESALQRLSMDQQASVQSQARQMMEDLEIAHKAWLSDHIALGFEQRLERAVALFTGSFDRDELRRSLQLAISHSAADHQESRIERLRMAARAWLSLEEVGPDANSIEEAARLHTAEGGWLDLTREILGRGDFNSEVAAAYIQLIGRVDAVREQRSRRFAELLAGAAASDTWGDCVPVERALEARVIPLADRHPVLVVLLDGLSEAAFQSIRASLDARSWVEIGPEGTERPPMLAALPSITEVSRASFFSGALVTGNQKAERDGFENKLSQFGDVQLLHKADLYQAEEAIRNENVRVVAAVINAIDDQLDKGEQANFDWTKDSIGKLGDLLAVAHEARRPVVIAGDHGHVLERGSEHRPQSSPWSRYRLVEPTSNGPGPNEVVVSGSRVLKGDGKVVLPAIEGLRYSRRAGGYHGGATPQEVVTPLSVLCPADMEVEGWAPCERSEPSWWLLEAPAEPAPVSPPPVKTAAPRVKHERQIAMFDEPTQPQDAGQAEIPVAPWIRGLLESEVFLRTYEATPRPPKLEVVTRLLVELDERQDVCSEGALAQALGMPESRIVPVVASIRPLLNLEGFQVLQHDRTSAEVRLDRGLLKQQFSL